MTNSAKQYAIALFSLAKEDNQTEKVYKKYNEFLDSIDDKVWDFFLNPKFSDYNKHKIIEAIFEIKLIINFFKTLIDNKRFDLIKDINHAYKELLNESLEILEIDVFTQSALSEENKEKLRNKFNKKFDKIIIINEVINPHIVGGIRIEYQGKVLDQTINSSLEKLKSSLIG
ncbi:MAG: ATP synthase F1 subunit delta [Bacillota bacterium]